MIAKKVKLENFGAYTRFEAELPEGTFDIIGLNGAGKSTLIKSLLACLKGVSKNQGGLVGERYQFIGNSGKTAKIEWILRDEFLGFDVVVKNHISKSTNSISFQAPEGSSLDKKWFDNLLSVALMTAKHFCSHSPKEQAALLGIDTNVYDDKIKNLKEEFTLLNRDLSNFGELGEKPEKVDEVSIEDLTNKLEEMQKDQKFLDDRAEAIKTGEEDVGTIEKKIIELEEELKTTKADLESTKASIITNKNNLSKLPKPNIEEIQEKLRTAGETNKKFTTWKTWTEDTKKKADAKVLTDKNKQLQKDQDNLKVTYMQKFKFPFSDMGVDDSGGLILKDRHINENGFSQGELELITAKIAIMLNPELRIRMIDDAKLLDPTNKTNVKNQLESEGFQVIFFLMDDKKTDTNSILLRECQLVDSYKEANEKML